MIEGIHRSKNGFFVCLIVAGVAILAYFRGIRSTLLGCAVMLSGLIPIRTAVVITSVLSLWRIQTPILSSSLGFSVGISDAAVIWLAFRLILFGRTLGAPKGQLRIVPFLATAAVLGVPGALLTAPFAYAPTSAFLGSLAGIIYLVYVMGLARWLEETGQILWYWKVQALVALVALSQAIIVPRVIPTLGLFATTTSGTVGRLGGIAGGFLAGFLICGAVACWLIISSGKARARPLTLIICSLLMAGVYFTYTRGAYIDAVIAIGVVAYVIRPSIAGAVRATTVAAAGALSLLALSQTTSGAGRRLAELSGDLSATTIHTRLSLWHASLELWKQRPLTGVGAGGFQSALIQQLPMALPRPFYEIFEYPEHQVLGLATETGVIGLLLYALGMGWLVRAVHRKLIWDTSIDSQLAFATFVIFAVSAWIGTWISLSGMTLGAMATVVAVVRRRHV